MTLAFIQPYFDLFCVVLWLIFRTWWWVIIPLCLYFPAKGLYLWWVRWEIEYAGISWTVLEFVPPSEVEKPFRAMEDIFTVLWSIYDGANWREQWCSGELPKGPYWMSFEITSKAGEIHFYIRTMKGTEKFVKGIIHAHYPDTEIFEVEDYVKNVPQDLPNEKYDVYMEPLNSVKDSSYPIKTYQFFEIRPEEIEQRKKIDPMSRLLEDMAKLKEGEELWFHTTITPVANKDNKWITRGRALADELSKRPVKPDRISMIGEALKYLFLVKPPYTEEKKEESVIPVEMRLTPGEREIVEGVENKITKKGFVVCCRAFYIYEPEAFVSPNKRIPRSYFMHFNTEHMNNIRDWSGTKTRIHYLFRKRRLYARKKKAFKKTINRFPPMFPNRMGKNTGTMVLNAEELASIIHLPMKAADLPPGVPRVAAKKGGPPPNIPTE
ncbi:MAG: hypothetical protein HQ539_01195 [Parcubacteria group bacterium]|nr:hypothetical protein [Parcubacteria group bacterium]